MGWEVGGRFEREWTYMYLWLIQADVWQKLTQYRKAIILQLKMNLNKKKSVDPLLVTTASISFSRVVRTIFK